MGEIFESRVKIGSFHTDLHGLCRPSSLLGFLQETATEHAAELGVARELLLTRHGCFWMLARLWCELTRPITFGDTVTIRTWHRGAETAVVYRDFDLLVNEMPVGEAVTTWVLADAADRRMLRPAAIPEFAASPRPSATKTRKPGKLALPEGLALSEKRKIHYSDADINGHMNNTRYVDLACDALGYGKAGGRYVSEIQVGFLAECFPGEELLVLTKEAAGKGYVLGADDAGKRRFEAALALRDQ